jgi:hypothetical protein
MIGMKTTGMNLIKLQPKHRGFGIFTHRINVIEKWQLDTFWGQDQFDAAVRWFKRHHGSSMCWNQYQLLNTDRQQQFEWCWLASQGEIMLRGRPLTAYLLADPQFSTLAESAHIVN